MPDPNPLSEVTTTEVANSVAAELILPVAGTVWSQTGFNCASEVLWLPVYSDADLATLQLCVLPVSEDDERVSRKHVQREHVVKVWLQKKVDPKPATYRPLVKAYAAFAFQIKDYWIAARKRLTAYPGVECTRAKVTPYSPKDLDERQLYVGVIELNFRETTNQ